jgi:Mce-associated membrane protein
VTESSEETSKDAPEEAREKPARKPPKEKTKAASPKNKAAEKKAPQDESPLPRLFLTAAVALVVAATAVAGWFGVAWINAANDDSLAFSQSRDEVNRVGQAAITTMNTLDYRKVDQGLKDWESATTGDLHNQIVKGRASSRDAIIQAQSVTKATPLSSAVSELDDRAGQASVLVALKVNVAVKGQQPADKFMRLEGKLQRTADGWKLYEIGQVPYLQPGQ